MRYAVIRGDLEAFGYLEDLIQDTIDKPDKRYGNRMEKVILRGFTFLDYAVFNDQEQVIQFLEKLGAKKTLAIHMQEVLFENTHPHDVQFTVTSQITGSITCIQL